MIDSRGFTLQNVVNFFVAPPVSFQLGRILILSETTIVLLGVFLVKRFPDLVDASIPNHRVKAVGMNPSGLHILQKAAQIGGFDVGGALVDNTINDAMNAYTADTALDSNKSIVRQASDALSKGKFEGSQYAQITSETAQSNAAIAKKSSTISFKN